MDGETKFLSFTAQCKKELLIEELSLLINSCEKQRLAVNSLVTSYYRFFGHKIYSRNFGFTTIQALVNGLDPTLFKVCKNLRCSSSICDALRDLVPDMQT